MSNDHHLSIRVPKELHEFIQQFAQGWQTSSAYVYRAAIREFVTKQMQREAA